MHRDQNAVHAFLASTKCQSHFTESKTDCVDCLRQEIFERPYVRTYIMRKGPIRFRGGEKPSQDQDRYEKKLRRYEHWKMLAAMPCKIHAEPPKSYSGLGYERKCPACDLWDKHHSFIRSCVTTPTRQDMPLVKTETISRFEAVGKAPNLPVSGSFDYLADAKTVRQKGTGAKSTSRDGFVYILTNPVHAGWVKIGSAYDLSERLSIYQTSDPMRRYRIVHFRAVDDKRKVETRIQETLSVAGAERINEWFRADVEIAIRLFENVVNQYDSGTRFSDI